MCQIRRYNRFLQRLLFHLVLIAFTGIADSKRLSFKESLTALAEGIHEKPYIPADHRNNYAQTWGQQEGTERPLVSTLVYHGLDDIGSARKNEVLDSWSPPVITTEKPPRETDKPTFWQIAKKLLLPLNQYKNLSTSIDLNTKTVNVSASLSATNEKEKLIQNIKPTHQPFFSVDNHQHGANTTESVLLHQDKNHTKSFSRILANWDFQNPRRKKHVNGKSQPALKDIMWQTALALWSGHKEHLLPTFLHTKTGGKLSLIRNSVFEPFDLITEFKNGIEEINKEKDRNLARQASVLGIAAVGIPVARTLFSILQRANSLAWTLTSYVYSLTRQTVTTKYKLKRMLRQFRRRIFQRLVRYAFRSRNNYGYGTGGGYGSGYGDNPSTIRILANAAWSAKRAIMRYLVRLSREPDLRFPPSYGVPESPSGPPSPVSYHGTDNSGNVDITYSALNNPNDNPQSDYAAPSLYVPPSPPPSPLNTYYTPPDADAGYAANSPPPPPPLNTYYTPPDAAAGYVADSPPPPPSTLYAAPVRSQQGPSEYSYYSAPSPSRLETPSVSYAPPPVQPDPSPSPVPSYSLPPLLRQQVPSEPSGYSLYPPQTSEVPIPKDNYGPPPYKSNLMEMPTYAYLLKTIGLKPLSDDQSKIPSATVTSSSKLASPKPTVTYYASMASENQFDKLKPIDAKPSQKAPVYSFNPSPALPSKYDKATESKTKASSAPLSFRIKLLENISGKDSRHV